MNNALVWTLSGLGGGLTGLLFFGGLWWTLRWALASPRPALWIVSSLLLRSGATVAAFLVVGTGDWQRLLACLLGFWIARQGVLRFTARSTVHSQSATIENAHAPQP